MVSQKLANQNSMPVNPVATQVQKIVSQQKGGSTRSLQTLKAGSNAPMSFAQSAIRQAGTQASKKQKPFINDPNKLFNQ